jgi:Immunity protein 49
MHKAMALVAYGAASNAPRDQILDAFRIEAQAGVALFDLGAHPGEDRTYALGSRTVTLRTESAHGETLPIEWLYAYSAACAVRDGGSAQRLAAVPPEVVRRSMRVMNYDEYNCALVEGLGALHRNDPRARALLSQARDLAEPERASVAPEWAKCMGRPLAELGLRIVEGEPNAFNVALAGAVEQHKAYWSKNAKTAGLSRRDDPHGILALWPLGLACLAHDRGMPIDVESDYIPGWIIRRGA